MDDSYHYPTPSPPIHINQGGYDDFNRKPAYDDDYNYDNYGNVGYGAGVGVGGVGMGGGHYRPGVNDVNNYNSHINPNPFYPPTHPPNVYGPHDQFEEGFPRPVLMSFWVRYFRYVPHLNLTFHRVNDSFDLRSPVYLESLGLIGSVPAGLLLFTLLVLLLYLLTRCCDNKSRTRGAITCCKVACILCALLTLGALGVSVWGSKEVHQGIMGSLHALSPINARLYTLHETTEMLTNQVRRNLQPQLAMFQEQVQNHQISNETVRDVLLDQLHSMSNNISEVLLINVEDINGKMRTEALSVAARNIEVLELIRWASTIGLAVLLMLVVLLLVLGAARHSRPTLITFSVFGLLSLIVCWALASFYLVASVALADWCIEPSGVALESWLGSVYSHRVARYYLRCDPERSSPFTKHLTRAQQSAKSVLTALNTVKNTADQHYPQEMVHPTLDHVSASVSQSQRSLGTIAALLECKPQHTYYRLMVEHTCTTAMDGLVYLLLSAVTSAILFSLLVWLASHTWIYLNAKTEQGSNEERESFLTGATSSGGGVARSCGGGQAYSGGNCRSGTRHSHTPPLTPPFPSTLNGRLYHTGTHKSEGGMNGSHHHHHHHTTATMPRESHSHNAPPLVGPNQGQYATLSKTCKTLESSDFY